MRADPANTGTVVKETNSIKVAVSEPQTRGKQQAPRLRCAIYTRKSTEEGLDQEFNSLDAQREACVAYITSQASLGWKLSPSQYDDGGISGGTMERPALTRLLDDIRNGHIDIIVVYKIDRLTRSLMDFARMVDLFDEKGISFVSVTQQFNTTTSMGRLTLNVLLSFAQFEREVTAERIKDKIAASKKKGMWMGGIVPLGYQSEDKKLVPHKAEAKTVKWLFERYLELGSVKQLSEQARDAGLSIRTVTQKNGILRKTRPFGRGNLYQLLSNPIYIGKIRHQDQIYDGQHEAIIDQVLWNAAQAKLAGNTHKRQTSTNTVSTHLLTGLVFDELGRRLSTTHTIKNGKRYYYYVSKNEQTKTEAHGNHDRKETDKPADGWRLSAMQLERPILKVLDDYLTDPIQQSDSLNLDKLTIHQQKSLLQANAILASTITSSTPINQKKLLSELFNRVELAKDKVVIELNTSRLVSKISSIDTAEIAPPNHIHKIEFHHQLQKRGVEAKLVLTNGPEHNPHPDPTLIKMIANAHLWLEHLTNGTANSIGELATQQSTDATEISRFLPLAFLAPNIIEDIMAGYQPVDLTIEKIRRMTSVPNAWNEQRQTLGFAA